MAAQTCTHTRTATRTGPDREHHAPLDLLRLLLSMICGHCGVILMFDTRAFASLSILRTMRYSWFLFHSRCRTNRAPPSNTYRMLRMPKPAGTATGQGTGWYRETSQRDEGD